jgi:hypothetical protein
MSPELLLVWLRAGGNRRSGLCGKDRNKSFFIEFMHLGVRQIATLCLVLSGEWAFCLL